jgi:hypothetical protein
MMGGANSTVLNRAAGVHRDGSGARSQTCPVSSTEFSGVGDKIRDKDPMNTRSRLFPAAFTRKQKCWRSLAGAGTVPGCRASAWLAYSRRDRW